MNSIVLGIYNLPGYHISINNVYYAVNSEKYITIILKDGTKSFKLKRNYPAHSSLLKSDHLIIKKLTGEYIMQNIFTVESTQLLPRNINGLSENTFPMLLLKESLLVDYSFYSPEKQLFAIKFDDNNFTTTFLNYRGMDRVELLTFDAIDQKIILVDTKNIYGFSLTDSNDNWTNGRNELSDGGIFAYYHKEDPTLITKCKTGWAKLNIKTHKLTPFLTRESPGMNKIFFRMIISNTQNFLAVVYSNQTDIYLLSTGELICTYVLKYNQCAFFDEDDKVILLGSMEKTYKISFDSGCRNVVYVLK